MKMTGNKGEWSEFYAFLRLLYLGKLYAADENVRKINDVYFPVQKIVRKENDRTFEYIIDGETGDVSIVAEGVQHKTVSRSYLSRVSKYLFESIRIGADRAFEIKEASSIMGNLETTHITASSADKTDNSLWLHDVFTGHNMLCGFSIKSELGGAPTLLNASGATNFVFKVTGISSSDMIRINSINTRNKIIDRISEICSLGHIEYDSLESNVFSSNLMLLDSNMEKILALMLMYYYQNRAINCKTLTDFLEADNPLHYPRKGFYAYKLKKFLCSVALGMVPSKEWDGTDEANGGYIIVKHDGDVLAYHLYNRNAFEEYLLNNTKLERGSTTRHGFAYLYEEDGEMYIKLNLQIRFK